MDRSGRFESRRKKNKRKFTRVFIVLWSLSHNNCLTRNGFTVFFFVFGHKASFPVFVFCFGQTLPSGAPTFLYSFFHTPLLSIFWTKKAVATGVVPSPRLLPSIFFAHRVQQSHCSSIFRRALLTHALALSASRFVHVKKSLRMCTCMHSGRLEPTKLTYIPGSRIT